MTQPFHFADGRVANDAKDLLELCEQFPDDATGFLVRQDLEKWLAYIGSHDVAECAVFARQIDVSDRQKLEDFLNRCHALTSPQSAYPTIAESAREIEDNPLVAASTSTMIEPLEVPTPQVATQESPVSELIVDPAPTKSLEIEVPIASEIPNQKPKGFPDTAPEERAAKSTFKVSQSPTATSSATESEEKPSFFQVVAKFLIRIIDQNKA